MCECGDLNLDILTPSKKGGLGSICLIRQLSSPNETSSSRNSLQIIKLLAKGDPETLPNSSCITKAFGCSLQTDGKAMLLKTRPKQLDERGEVELVPN